ncbi:MAG: glycosyltransferase, partial [Mucilaginibacter sp.]
MKVENNPPVVSIVVPCYNEEAGLTDSAGIILRKLLQLSAAHLISTDSFILFVDDGSRDATWDIITKHAGPGFKGLKLSNNVGHQKALIAGLH